MTTTTNKNTKSVEPPKVKKQFNIRSDDRVFICGKTGSGKSTLAKHLLLPAKHLIVIDGKDSEDIRDEWNVEEYSKSKHLNDIRHNKLFRIRLTDNQEDIITVLNTAYQYGNCLIYIDEITATIPKPTSVLPIYRDLWTRGRSRNIGAWGNTQRPSFIPIFMMSEAEHDFIFRLNVEDDRKKVAGFVGKQVLSPPKDIHGFFYYNLVEDKLSYYTRLKI